MQLILIRHGESEWNLLNQFTGWTDVGLTENGIQEAQFAAEKILQENILIKTIYTSILLRSTHTTAIIANVINFNKKDIQYDWRLNERHYGALQGLNKSETAAKYGENQVQLWRRSYDIAPPLLSDDDKAAVASPSKDSISYKSIFRALAYASRASIVLPRTNFALPSFFQPSISSGFSFKRARSTG